MLLPLVAFPGGDSSSIESINHLAIAGHVFVQLRDDLKGDKVSADLADLLRTAPCHVGLFEPHQADIATQVLDSGAHTVVFSLTITPDAAATREAIGSLAESVSSLPSNRVKVQIIQSTPNMESIIPAITALKPHASGFIVPVTSLTLPADDIKALKAAVGSRSLALTLSSSSTGHAKAADVARLHRHDVAVLYESVIAGSNEEVEGFETAGKLDVGTCLAACARSDRPDGLFTTVVSDECGKVLGLVYSSQESILHAIRSKRGIYFSRSRGGLWRKGDTSGCWQALLSVRLDCDSDALLFTTRQMGSVPSFCHLETRSCWGEDNGLSALERTLAARLVDAPAGSYTKRLFDDPTLLRHKLLEEAQELSEATDADHVAAEAADVIYFTLVACAKAGVSLADVEKHLDKRALKVRRRPGDSKPARIAAAQAHFDALKEAKE